MPGDDDDLEQLIVSMSADYKSFQNDLQKANQTFKTACNQIVAQQADLNKKVNSGFANMAAGFKASLLGLGGVELFKSAIDSAHNLADETLNTSRSLGISAENLQGWSILAKRAGVDQDTFNMSLAHFSAAVGDAQLKTTPFSISMAKLGVDIKDGPEAALLSFADKIGTVPKAQQAAFAQMAFGRGGLLNTGWLTDGAKTIQAMVEQFQQLGMVVPTDQLEKVNQIFDAWQDIKTEALTGFMSGFSSFAGQIETPQFQQSIQTFGKVMGDVSGAIVNMAPYLPMMVEAFATFNGAKGGAMIGDKIGSFLGPEGKTIGIGIGAVGGGLAGYFGSKSAINGLVGQPGGALAPVKAAAPAGTTNLAGSLDVDQTAHAAAQIADLNKSLDQQVTQTAQKGEDAYADMVKATLDAATEAARGTSAYYGMLQAQIVQTAQMDIDKVNQEKDAAIAAAQDRMTAEIAAIDASHLTAAQKTTETAAIIASYHQQEVDLAATSADQIITINTKKNQQLLAADWKYQEQQQDVLDVTNTLRDGLDNVAEAGVQGFKSMKDAAAEFLDQIAQTIIKLYVMQPILDKLFGPANTSGGGLLGGLIGSLFGGGPDLSTVAVTPMNAAFADGGVMTSRGPLPLRKYAGGGVANTPQVAMFGEGSGPEAFVPLKNGSIPVNLTMPPMRNRGGAAAGTTVQVVQNFDLSGSMVDKNVLAMVDRMSSTKAASAVKTAMQPYNLGPAIDLAKRTRHTKSI